MRAIAEGSSQYQVACSTELLEVADHTRSMVSDTFCDALLTRGEIGPKDMPRPTKYDEASIIKVAAAIAAAQGPQATTVTAIAQAIGAPSGSIYHRFPKRDELLGRLWLVTAARFQQAWADALSDADAKAAGLAAALSIPKKARDDFESARIMLLYRREDFASGTWPADMREEAKTLQKQVTSLLSRMSVRLFGNQGAEARQTTTFALVDVPYSAVRRYVMAGEKPPPFIDSLIAKAYQALVP
jgi:AcrR family transcriptional regulator